MSNDTDRDSIYLDTLSMQSGSTNYNNRKSIALSQQTIYHSTEDLPAASTTSLKGYSNEYFIDSQQQFHSDMGLNEFEVDGGETPLRARIVGGSGRENTQDEVSALLELENKYSNSLLIPSSHQTNKQNKQKTKQIVTYNEWKSRVKPALLYHIVLILYIYFIFNKYALVLSFNSHFH